MSITKAQLRTLRNEMQAALDKAGITDFKLEVGNMRYTATTVNIKVAGTVKTADGTVAKTPADLTFERKIAELGLKMIGPKGERLTEYKESRWKYPFGYTTVRGARYKCSEVQARAMFG